MTLSRLAALRRLGGIKQAAYVRRRAERVSRLLPGGVESHRDPKSTFTNQSCSGHDRSRSSKPLCPFVEMTGLMAVYSTALLSAPEAL
jgi:hypothetical protein